MMVDAIYRKAAYDLHKHGVEIHTQKWQGVDIEKSPGHKMIEVIQFRCQAQMFDDPHLLQLSVSPNLPWAENHFGERVGGKPVNPGDTFKDWPYYKRNPKNDQFRQDEQFTHTYMERMWAPDRLMGIRFEYGNLSHVINLLLDEPDTRQAYLPVWFPEDTGVRHGGRVPCTIGYHFLVRNEQLHVHYLLRSCDLVRHLQDDIYLANRLAQHVAGYLEVKVGMLDMSIGSLHCWANEKTKLVEAYTHGRRIG